MTKIKDLIDGIGVGILAARNYITDGMYVKLLAAHSATSHINGIFITDHASLDPEKGTKVVP